MGNNNSGARNFFGFVLIAVGVWFLLEQLDVLDLGGPWRWAPSFFILFILWHMVRSGFRNLVGPLIMIGIALLIQLSIVADEYNLDFDRYAGALWPAIIILIGLAVVFRGRGGRGPGRARSVGGDDLDILTVFGGSEERINSAEFKGGRVTSVFGGAEIDLRGSTVAARPATIDVTVLFGAAEITVPEDWSVEREVFAIFGGSADKRRTPGDSSAEPDLVITGIVLFGGLEIKD
jgi:hypothetical protein